VTANVDIKSLYYWYVLSKQTELTENLLITNNASHYCQRPQRENCLMANDGLFCEYCTAATFVFSLEKRLSKAIPLQPLTGPEGSRRVRLPDFKTISTLRW
jgi:hypothetical protein